MPKILYISNIAGRKLGLSFLGSAMYAAKELGYEFHVAANRSAASEEQTKSDEEEYGIKLHHIDLVRAPYSLKNVKAFKQLCKLIHDEQIDYIHCNTPTGGILGRLAGKKCKVKKVIYQAHGFHFYKGASRLNWMVYYPVERWLARYTDALITINREDEKLAENKLHLRNKGRVYYVPGVGIDLTQYGNAASDGIRKSLGIADEDVVLISAGRLDTNKNNATTIRAVAKVPGVKLLLCGDGDQKEKLQNLANTLGVSDRVFFLGNRSDIQDLYQAADIFVMMSFREGLSRSIMEAMASGLPCIVSRIRGNVDLIEDGAGGYTVMPVDDEALAEKIRYLAQLQDVRKRMCVFNRAKINDFSQNVVKEELKHIYETNFAVSD